MPELEPLKTVEEAAVKLWKALDWLTRRAGTGEVPSRTVGQTRCFTDSDLAAYPRVQVGGERFPQADRSYAQRNRRRGR